MAARSCALEADAPCAIEADAGEAAVAEKLAIEWADVTGEKKRMSYCVGSNVRFSMAARDTSESVRSKAAFESSIAAVPTTSTLANARGRPTRTSRPGYQASRKVPFCGSLAPMTKSSIFCPARSASVSQRGRLPRPDHVSEGSFGFRYFGGTLACLRDS